MLNSGTKKIIYLDGKTISPQSKESRCCKFVKGKASVDLILFVLESPPLTNFPQHANGRLVGEEWWGVFIPNDQDSN